MTVPFWIRRTSNPSFSIFSVFFIAAPAGASPFLPGRRFWTVQSTSHGRVGQPAGRSHPPGAGGAGRLPVFLLPAAAAIVAVDNTLNPNMSENNSIKHCSAFCLALRFDINELAAVLSKSTLIRIIKGALLIEDEDSWQRS